MPDSRATIQMRMDCSELQRQARQYNMADGEMTRSMLAVIFCILFYISSRVDTLDLTDLHPNRNGFIDMLLNPVSPFYLFMCPFARISSVCYSLWSVYPGHDKALL
jgi:hypothetical protein